MSISDGDNGRGVGASHQTGGRRWRRSAWKAGAYAGGENGTGVPQRINTPRFRSHDGEIPNERACACSIETSKYPCQAASTQLAMHGYDALGRRMEAW